MALDFYTKIYLDKSIENFELYKVLSDINKFEAWQITAIFYSALCLAKAYLYSKGLNRNSINSHESIKNLLSYESEAKRNNVFYYYEKLYFDNRDARYSIKKISKNRIENALKNYQEVKKRLKIS